MSPKHYHSVVGAKPLAAINTSQLLLTKFFRIKGRQKVTKIVDKTGNFETLAPRFPSGLVG